MSLTLDIAHPKIYQDLFSWYDPAVYCQDFSLELLNKRRPPTFLVEHAALDVKDRETCAAIATREMIRGKTSVIITPTIARVKLKVHQILEQYEKRSGRKFSRYSGEGAFKFSFKGENNSGEIWILGEKAELPVSSCDYKFIIEAQRFDLYPQSSLSFTREIIFGQLAKRSHWFYRFVHEPYDAEKLSIAMPEIVEQWPQEVLEEDDPNFERLMLLKDTDMKLVLQNSRKFFTDRIFIRTDRKTEELSPRQQEFKRSQAGTPIVPLEVSRLQKKYNAAKRLAVMKGKKPWYILLKYRRGGFTTLEQAESYATAIQRPNSQVLTLADTTDKTKRIFRMVNIMAEHDPRKVQLISESKTELGFANGSLFFIGTAGGRSMARGDTLQRAHGSEVAFWSPGPNQTSDVNNTLAGIVGACQNGTIVLESTPNGRNHFYTAYKDARDGHSEFNAIFVRWFDDPLNIKYPGTYDPEEIRDTLTKEEADFMAKHNLTLAHIAFRREKQRVHGVLFDQEYPEDDEKCFLTSGICYFSLEVLMKLLDQCEEPIERTEVKGGYEKIWAYPEPGEEYVLGADTSEGIAGLDKSGIGVLNKRTGEHVYSSHGYFKPHELAHEIKRISMYYNRALCGVERNNHGHATVQKLVELEYGEPHFLGGPLFYCTVNNSGSGFEKHLETRAGWQTDKLTRPVMLQDLDSALKEGHLKTNDNDFLGECTTFCLQSNGKWEASSGAHDDTVIKMAIAWQMRNANISSVSLERI